MTRSRWPFGCPRTACPRRRRSTRLATNAAVREEIQQYVDKANATVSRAESVRKFAVLGTQFTQENKCLTPSLKVVRPAVNRVFADVIDNEIYNGKR